jgi:ketosteroid isomerase-like protein
MSDENVEGVRAGLAAMTERDIEGLKALTHPDIEMRMRGVAGEPVRYAGHAGIEEYFRDMAESWQGVEWEPEEIRDLGDRVLVIATQRLRGRASGIDVETRVGMACVVRSGLVVEIEAGYDLDEIRRLAGE